MTASKAATALNKHLPASRALPLDILLQVNTSGEASKSGLAPLADDADADTTATASTDLAKLALHVLRDCPRLRLLGLMTIGSLEASLADSDGNRDFETLVRTRDALHQVLRAEAADFTSWGRDGKLLLSMGMSSDFAPAIQAGSDIVRVGTSIFGSRLRT